MFDGDGVSDGDRVFGAARTGIGGRLATASTRQLVRKGLRKGGSKGGDGASAIESPYESKQLLLFVIKIFVAICSDQPYFSINLRHYHTPRSRGITVVMLPPSI